MDRLERRWPPSLIRYRQCVRVFLKWLFLRGVPLGSLSIEHVRDFSPLTAPSARSLPPSTSDNFSLRHFFRWGRRQHLWPIVPLENSAWRHAARRSPRPTPFRRYFSELDALLRYQSLPDSRLLNDYSADLRKNGFGYRQIKFILANIATFLEFLLRRHKRTTDASAATSTPFPSRPLQPRQRSRQSQGHLRPPFPRLRQSRPRRRIPHPSALSAQTGSLRFLGRDFLDFCRLHRGLRPSTCRTHRDILISFDSFLTHRGITNLRRLSPNDIEAFFLARSLRLRPLLKCPFSAPSAASSVSFT
ncbi:MAG: site-specific integrase [Elusimicrobia bacterium]|nr:site-specific integrase [Elusimicrobiota bacterium]